MREPRRQVAATNTYGHRSKQEQGAGDNLIMFFRSLWRTSITGAALLIPLFALLYFAIQGFKFIRNVVRPIVDLLGIERVAGLLVLNLAALAILGAICLMAGLAAKSRMVTKRVEALDRTLSRRVPGYSIIVGMIRGAIDDDFAVEQLKTVLVSMDGGKRIGFEVERMPTGDVVVYFPNAPNPQSGFAMAFRSSDVEIVDVKSHHVFDMMQFFGKGMASVVAEGRSVK